MAEKKTIKKPAKKPVEKPSQGREIQKGYEVPPPPKPSPKKTEK